MLTALQNAYDAAVASIDIYSKVPVYLAKANTIDESIAADYQSQYNAGTLTEDAETIFQNLEVATYNFVTNEFSYPVELEANAWIAEGPTASLSGQHYDGSNSSSY